MLLFCFPGSSSNGVEFRELRKSFKGQSMVARYSFRKLLTEEFPEKDGVFVEYCTNIAHDIYEQTRTTGESIVILGNSVGCLFAYQCAALLERRGKTPLSLILLSPPPADQPTENLPSSLDEAVTYFEGLIPGIDEFDPELARDLCEVGVLDIEIGSQFYNRNVSPVKCPIRIFSGKFDKFANDSSSNSWRPLSESTVDIDWVSEGHTSVVDNQDVQSYLNGLR